eukprot:scaffold83197_cov63-Attheya_sp.AAC.2
MAMPCKITADHVSITTAETPPPPSDSAGGRLACPIVGYAIIAHHYRGLRIKGIEEYVDDSRNHKLARKIIESWTSSIF